MSSPAPLPRAHAWWSALLLCVIAGCGGSNEARPPATVPDAAPDAPADARDMALPMDAAPEAGDVAATDASSDTPADTSADAGDAAADAWGDVPGDAADGGDAGDASDAGADGSDTGVDFPPGCAPACPLGSRRCGPGGGVQLCQTDSGGCPVWSAESTCPTRQACTGAGSCTCVAPPAGCDQVGEFCLSPTSEAACVRDENGCLYQNGGATSCPAGQTCKGAPAGCSCDSTCTAAEVGSYCKDARTLATCAPLDGCFQSSSPVACAGARTCQGTPGSALCACPAAAAALGAGCTPGAAPVCAGAHILTCVGDPQGSGCFVWASLRNCADDAAGPLACGLSAGVPTCLCAPAGATDVNVFVDPVAGNDTSALVPTGAEAPAACRFRTLGRALAATTATRNRVVAKSAGASAAAPATFIGESFPLLVPAGVTVTTGDALPTPANYVISFTAPAAPAAVTLTGGAALSGFTIVNPGAGNQAAAAVRCSSGAVGLVGVTLVGGGPTGAKQAIGVALGNTTADSCTATLTGVRVQAFDVGVRVATAATAPITLLDSDLENDGIGLLIAGGAVTATRLTISRSTGGEAGDGVLLEATSAVEPSLMATDLAVLAVQGRGIDVAAPAAMARAQLHLDGGRVEGAGGDGVRFRGGVMTARGTAFTGSGAQGVHVLGGAVALRRVSISGSVGRGLHVDGGAVTADEGSRLGGNGKASGAAGARLSTGNLVLGNAFNDPVDIDDSGSAGVEVNTASGSGTTHRLTLTNAVIRRNAGHGLTVTFAGNSAGTVSVTGGAIHGNANHGVEINRSPAPAGGGQAVSLEGVAIHDNGSTGASGRGVSVLGNGPASVLVRGCTIRNNRAYGLLVQQGGGTTTTSIDGNDIHTNNTAAGHTVGGVLFATTSTLASFTGNRIHNNGGDELGFEAAPPSGTWNVSVPACGAAQNQIYCYGVGSVGLRAAGGSYTVNAQRVSWVSAAPGTGGAAPDVRVLGAQTVNVGSACPAIGAQCP